MADTRIEEKIKIIQGSKNKTYTFIGVTILIVLVLLLGAIRPTIIKISTVIAEVDARKTLQTQLNNKIDAISKLSKEYNTSYKDLFADLSLVYPARGDFSLFMANVEQVTNKNNFELVSIGFESEKVDDTSMASYNILKPWFANVTIKGQRSDLIKWMRDIESFPNYPQITSVSFGDKVDDEGMMSFSVRILMYKIDDSEFYLK
ncbi:MAG TPA: hypothetical protein PLX79_01800 [Candidatus Dojkabacteria bacterium]|nr:hypothetical protein [Candidatus Dojkabacteria bacterium]